VSYRCGLEPTLAKLMGAEPGGPWVTCDGCGLRLTIRSDRMPPAWLLDNKAAPGWSLTHDDNGKRTDLCKTCKPSRLLRAKAGR
jgi:hypothetical protein